MAIVDDPRDGTLEVGTTRFEFEDSGKRRARSIRPEGGAEVWLDSEDDDLEPVLVCVGGGKPKKSVLVPLIGGVTRVCFSTSDEHSPLSPETANVSCSR